uniref:Uncharacterized protein n=1 Tax=Solanum tuberosum TaxID=4113 RepID=M1AD57_SOLTU
MKALAFVGSSFKNSKAYIRFDSFRPSISITACRRAGVSMVYLLYSIVSARCQMLDIITNIVSCNISERRVCVAVWPSG